MQNYRGNEDIIEIRSELMTLKEYLEVCTKVIFKEELGYVMDYEEFRYELDTVSERFDNINDLLLKIESDISDLEWEIEYEQVY